MIYLIGFVWIIYLILFFLSRKIDVSKKEKETYLLFLFRRIGLYLISLKYSKYVFNKQVEKNLQILEPIAEKKNTVENYYANKLEILLLLFFLGIHFIFFIQYIEKVNSVFVDSYNIVREQGEDSYQTLDLLVNDGKDVTALQYELRGTVLKKDELEKKIQEFEKAIDQHVLGTNVSLEEVKDDLILKSQYEGYPFIVEWETDNYNCINSDGMVHNEELTDVECVNLTAIITYDVYEYQFSFSVKVKPKEYDEKTKKQMIIQKQLEEDDEKQKEKDVFTLPEKIDGSTVTYQLEDHNQVLLYVLILFLILISIYYANDQDLGKKVIERNKQLEDDYPDFVAKFVLLLGAGMSVRNILAKMSQDAFQGKYLTQELKILVRDLNNGILESRAIDDFGKRCKHPLYIKFCAYIIQNQKKGTRDLVQVLELEAKDAFIQKKNNARKLGEEAGTKLLVPMTLMLVLVMVLIILPAFMSFQI